MSNDQVTSFKEKFVINSGYIFFSTFVSTVFTSLNTVVIARLLGPESYGVLTILLYIGGVVTMCGSLNIPGASIKFIAEKKRDDIQDIGKILGNVSLILVLTLIILFIAINLFSADISKFYDESSLDLLLRLYMCVVIFSVLSDLLVSALAGIQNMKAISIFKTAISVISLPITIVLIFYFNIYGAIAAQALNLALLAAVSAIEVRKAFRTNDISINFSPDPELIKKILGYSMPLFISGIAYTTFLLFGPTVLSQSENYSSVGFYKVALAVQGLILFLPNAVNYNLIPSISNLSVSEPRKVPVFSTKVIKIIAYIILPIIIISCIFSSELILVLFGNEYSNAVPVTYILILSTFFISMTGVAGAILRGIGKTKLVMLIDIGINLSFIIMSYYLIMHAGLPGLAYTYVLSYGLATAACIVLLSMQGLTIPGELKSPLCLSAVVLLASYGLTLFFSGLLLYVTGLLLLCITLVIEWKVLDEDDRMLILKMADKMKFVKSIKAVVR